MICRLQLHRTDDMFMIIHDICISYLFFVLPTDLVLEPATHRFILKDFRVYKPLGFRE